MAEADAIKVLILEDIPTDAELVERALRKAGLHFTAKRVDTQDDFSRALDEFAPDIVLSDYKMPGFDGLAALAIVRQKQPDLPVIEVTGALGDEAAVELVKSGAVDYVLKDRMARLPSAVEHALAHVAELREHRRAEQELQFANIIVEQSPVILFRALAKKGFPRVYMSRNVARFGYTADEAKSGSFRFPDYVHTDDRPAVLVELRRLTTGSTQLFEMDYRIIARDGSVHWVHDCTAPIRDSEGQIVAYQGTLIDVTERKEAEEALRASHALLDRTERIAAIGGWEWDTVNDVVVGSEEVYRIFGRDSAIFAPTVAGLIDAVHPEYRKRVKDALSAALAGMQQFDLEFRIRRPDETERFVHARAEVERDRSGKPVRLTGTAHDITERKQAEERVREEEEKFRSLVEQNVAGIAIIRADGTVHYMNPYFASMMGYTAAEIIGRDLIDFIPQAERDAVRKTWQAHFSGKRPFVQLASAMQAKDGRAIDILVNASLANVAGQPASIATVLDVTERNKAEAALHESQRLVEGILNAIPVRVFWKDKSLHYLGCNAVFARDAGFADPKDIVGKDDYQMGWRDQAEMYRSADREVIESGVSKLLLEEPATTPNGEIMWLLTSKIPLRNPNGEIEGVLGTYLDITERREAERVLHRVNRALRTLSSGNEVLVRAGSESELLHEMCRVIVEVGGYRIAWIGEARQDEAKTVMPIAWAGAQAGFLRQTSCSWADEPTGRGPSGRAIRTGLPQTSQNLAADPLMEPWLAEAQKRGFASAGSLPLKDGSRVFGVLTIYAAEPDAFDADELKLLLELATDLSFGIRALRDRAERDAAERRWHSTLEATIGAIASTVEMRDSYTAGHQQRVAKLAVAIARELGLREDQIRGIYLAGIIHDVGKITVPAEILSKPGKLSPIEFQLIQAHAQLGYDIVKGVDFPWPIAEMILQHHERLDGSGYPNALTGDQMLVEAKILAVSDVVEAMMSRRPYREALGIDAALAEIEQGRGRLYDVAAVDACVRLFRERGFDFQ